MTALTGYLEKIDTPIILVDFHAEATAEKIAMAYHLDGRVSAVFGTHTHVQTADEAIFPKVPAILPTLGIDRPDSLRFGCQTRNCVCTKCATHASRTLRKWN